MRSLIAVGALSALLLAGCGGGAATTSSEGAVGGAAPVKGGAQPNAAPGAKSGVGAPSDAGAPSVVGAQDSPAEISKPGAPVVGVGPKLTKSASLDLRVENISSAAARVRSIAAGLQTLILSEQIGKGGPEDPRPLQDSSSPGPLQDSNETSHDLNNFKDFNGFGTLTLSVPSDKLDTALDQLSKIGTVLARNTSTQDVTSQYVDTESRLKTMTASVARVRALMSQAKDLGQVVELEGEVSRREADLESLQSQLDALKNSVERSTLAVSLSTTNLSHEPVPGDGFVAGLRSGWDAFTASAGGLLTAVGAVLPFAAFLALVGAPIWWSWRRRRANRVPITPAPITPAPMVPSA